MEPEQQLLASKGTRQRGSRKQSKNKATIWGIVWQGSLDGNF
jgi:hypothetical protein